MTKQKLLKEFFEQPTLTVAKSLIGKYLVRTIGGKTTAYMITETEAYDGFHDKGSHAHRGETPRNSVMFGDGGHIYVYFTYGMHHMLNIVTGKHGFPAAVLVRAVEGISGPGRLTKALGIDKTLNTLPLSRKSGLWVEDRGTKIEKKNIKRTPRIGIRYAGPVWGNKKYRFVHSKVLENFGMNSGRKRKVQQRAL